MPRSFNYASAVLYDNLFQVLAGQSMVNRNDYMVSDRVQPMGAYYHLGVRVRLFGWLSCLWLTHTHTQSKGHMSGDVDQWLVNCWGNNENATCLGDGSSTSDHLYCASAWRQRHHGCGADLSGAFSIQTGPRLASVALRTSFPLFDAPQAGPTQKTPTDF